MELGEMDFDKWWAENGFDQLGDEYKSCNAKELALQAFMHASNMCGKYPFRQFNDECRQTRWDKRFLELARHVASWSKDPSTKTGAVIVDPDGRVVSVGYNGFAKGVDDNSERYADRDLKYKMIVHSERNAIIFAKRDIKGCTLYTWPFPSCSVCSAMVIQSGIVRCVAPPVPHHLLERWGHDMNVLAASMFKEAGVQLVEIEG